MTNLFCDRIWSETIVRFASVFASVVPEEEHGDEGSVGDGVGDGSGGGKDVLDLKKNKYIMIHSL